MESLESDAYDPIQRQPFSGLATKIILFVFASTFLTATVVSWISIQSTHDSLREVIDRLYPRSLDRAEAGLAVWLEELEAALDDTASRESKLGQSQLERALASSTTEFVGLAVLGSDGVPRATAGRIPEHLSRIAVAEAGATAFPTPLGDGDWALAIAVPRASGGALLGVAPFGRIAALLDSELPSDAAVLVLSHRTGKVLAVAGTWQGPEPIDPVELGSHPSRDELREFDLGGTRVIGASRRVEALDGSLGIVTPFEVAYGPVLSVVTRIFVTDLCIILVFSFLAYRVTARVVRPIEDLSEAARRVAQGHTDLEIRETTSRDEIGLLTRTFNDMMRQLRRHRHEIEDANRTLTDRNTRLQQANEVLNQLSITDGLTKLHNHRFFQDHLTREIKRVSRSKEPLSMLLIDIDDFKRLNDRLGHAAGDEILARIAKILNGAVRESDLCARYGGEEFVILAANTDVAGGYGLAEKVRTAIAESSFIVDDSLRPLRATVSIGVAQFGGNRKRFFQKTDQALYQAKAAGKNCVVMNEDDSDAIA